MNFNLSYIDWPYTSFADRASFCFFFIHSLNQSIKLSFFLSLLFILIFVYHPFLFNLSPCFLFFLSFFSFFFFSSFSFFLFFFFFCLFSFFLFVIDFSSFIFHSFSVTFHITFFLLLIFQNLLQRHCHTLKYLAYTATIFVFFFVIFTIFILRPSSLYLIEIIHCHSWFIIIFIRHCNMIVISNIILIHLSLIDRIILDSSSSKATSLLLSLATAFTTFYHYHHHFHL